MFMYMYMYAHTYMYIHLHIYIYVCMYIYTCIRIPFCKNLHIYTFWMSLLNVSFECLSFGRSLWYFSLKCLFWMSLLNVSFECLSYVYSHAQIYKQINRISCASTIHVKPHVYINIWLNIKTYTSRAPCLCMCLYWIICLYTHVSIQGALLVYVFVYGRLLFVYVFKFKKIHKHMCVYIWLYPKGDVYTHIFKYIHIYQHV